ncbi:MAG: transglutaminase family protein [Oscillospiraceae bacterium]
MKHCLQSDNLKDYLKSSKTIDFLSVNIQEQAQILFNAISDELNIIKIAFNFTRDDISHSWDIKSKRITKSASEVLRYKEGICYAKSMLLAALLRSQQIPCGICYQKLTLGDTPDTGYCIHALNAVYISSIGSWVRIDARGNTNGKDAQFHINNPSIEQLAFPIRKEYGEIDYPIIYIEPLPITVETLENNIDCIEMIKYNLPTFI